MTRTAYLRLVRLVRFVALSVALGLALIGLATSVAAAVMVYGQAGPAPTSSTSEQGEYEEPATGGACATGQARVTVQAGAERDPFTTCVDMAALLTVVSQRE